MMSVHAVLQVQVLGCLTVISHVAGPADAMPTSSRALRLAATGAIVLLLLTSLHHAYQTLHVADNAGDVVTTPVVHHSPLATAGAPPIPPPAVVAASVTPDRLDGSLDAALARAVPPGRPRVLLLTFGNSKVGTVLDNFIAHASAVGAPFVVGAVDAALYDRLSTNSKVAVYKTPLAMQSFQLDGANSHASSSWNRFAVMRSGEVARVVNLGYDVLHTDSDIAWLRNPAPYIACAGGGAASLDAPTLRCDTLAGADVAVSTDNMSPGEDARGGAGYLIGGTLNTGLLLIRATPAGTAFANGWHGTVVRRSCPATGRNNCTRLCDGWCAPDGSCAGDCNEGRCCTTDQQVLNRMIKVPPPSGKSTLHWTGLAVPRGPARTARAANDTIVLGALPLALFLHGHGYFVQGAAHRRAPVARNEAITSARPYAVHATYTLDDHEGLAKAQRFREGGLWRVDQPSYFEGRYLAYNATLPPDVEAAIDKLTATGAPAASIGVHMAAVRSYMNELRDALALAQAMGRTLILPRWTCFCDRLWSGSDDIFAFGCMYPGAQDGQFVPFTCPMDHVLSPTGWGKAGIPYRDAIFIDNLHDPTITGQPPPTIAEIDVGGAPSAEGGRRADGRRWLPLGLSDVQAAKQLAPWADAQVIRLSSARGLLCGLEGSDRVRAFERLLRPPWPTNGLLTPPPWCSTCYKRCDVELRQWLEPADIAKGADPANPNRWCARWEPPAALPDANGACAAVAA